MSRTIDRSLSSMSPKRRRRIEITVETDQVVIVKKPVVISARCALCRGHMIPIEEATVIAGVTLRVIHRLVETGRAHFAETEAGPVLLCLDSLFKLTAGDESMKSL